ncbi:LRR domain containing protein [Parasponia andersonii]|uniref:LRR domain containing protein n=1 Tax=Parasponia andersonii TaxID=3476 RepID=A0A2P5BRJ4_PARAD|nr:LRR domain containing protein [Parasponia andersonii]
MEKAPSLTSLCMEAVKDELLRGDDLLPVICELPSHLFDILLLQLPPLALQKLQMAMDFSSENEYDDVGRGNGRKRGRFSNLDKAWRSLFELRWPELVNQHKSVDWQQIYWETHLQNCLDEAAEIAVLPSFDGHLGEVKIPDSILQHIGYEDYMKAATCDYSNLSYHCQDFGFYARCLRLQNIICGAETSHLLRNSKLQSLVLWWIRSKDQVGGLCKLLSQNIETLSSLEFVHCKLSSASIDEICGSLVVDSVPTHGIQNFSISTSSFVETNPVSLPLGLVSFLSSGRSLCSLKFSYNHLGRNFAEMVFNTLCDASSGLSILDLSENNITGWLSDFSQRSSSSQPTSLGRGKALQSLRVLNIRGNNLNKDDALGLRYAMVHMPNLEVLDISDNPIEDGGIRSLLPYFIEASEKCSPFNDLYLENCDLSISGVISLINTFSTFKRPLKSLSIADNVLGSQVAAALGKFLSTSIQVLNISAIGLGSPGFEDLQTSIEQTQELKLVEINISKNRGGIATANFLSTLMLRAPKLVSVDAAYNFMPVEASYILCPSIKAAKGNLGLLDLRGNNLHCQATHGLFEIQHAGKPVLILSSSLPATVDAPHDDDP